jgi:hypothetical protein
MAFTATSIRAAILECRDFHGCRSNADKNVSSARASGL